jgi:hypothetical protein
MRETGRCVNFHERPGYSGPGGKGTGLQWEYMISVKSNKEMEVILMRTMINVGSMRQRLPLTFYNLINVFAHIIKLSVPF